MFLFMLRTVWFVLKHPGVVVFGFGILFCLAVSIYLLSGLFGKRLPETIPSQGVEPTEAEFNSPE